MSREACIVCRTPELVEFFVLDSESRGGSQSTDSVRFVPEPYPACQGRFLPGCGVEIVAPESLRDFKPDLILIANPLYEDEIRRMVADLGLVPELEVI